MIEIYIGSEKLDTFKDEDINIKLSVQNIKDISKVFADYTQNFSVPASKANNAVFKHYYNADISGGFDASLRKSATILLDKEPFREGSIELLSVNLKNGVASSYEIVFFSAGVNLQDLFGEDQLTDLDLSTYDHAYTGANVRTGAEAGLSSGNIIYPLISPKEAWFYNSDSSSHDDYNLSYHTTNDNHGLHYYELKPAVRLARIIDAIERKYDITFNSDFFASDKFTNLYMWCHRREGYMFFGQQNGFTAQKIDFTSATGLFDTATDTYTSGPFITNLIWRYSITSTDDYQVHWYVNGQYVMSRQHSGNVTNNEVYLNAWLSGGDKVQMRFSPPVDWNGNTITITSCSSDGRPSPSGVLSFTASTSSSQSFVTDVIVSDQMPEQKVSDFMVGLIKMFNLALQANSNTTFTLEPLDDWYADGSTYDITQYTDITSTQVRKPELYRRLKLEHQLADSVAMRQHRLTSGGIGYGDLRADFTFDGGELTNQTTFELLRFDKLTDTNTGNSVDFLVGKSIDKDLEPYIGAPMIFYSNGTLDISGTPIGFLDETGLTPSPADPMNDCVFIANVDNQAVGDVTQMLTFGLEIDPYHEQSFNQTLYGEFWEDYVTDLYSTSRRVYSYKAILPMSTIYQLKMNDKLIIAGKRYVINEVNLNLRTREATLQLLNDV